MRTKLIVTIAIAGIILDSCADDRELDVVSTNGVTNQNSEKKISKKSVEKVSVENDTVRLNTNSLLEEVSDGGDPKDVPPRRRSNVGSPGAENKYDSIRPKIEILKDLSSELSDGGDPKDVPPRR